MFEQRIKQLKTERENLNMRIAEVNFLNNGYETAEKEKADKADKAKKEKK